jgi:hypothetical protein
LLLALLLIFLFGSKKKTTTVENLKSCCDKIIDIIVHTIENSGWANYRGAA